MSAGDVFNKELKSNPERFIQPWTKTDTLNGNKVLVNPKFVELYGNPYNDNVKNKFDPYVEKESEYKIKGSSQNEYKKGVASWGEIKNDAKYELLRFWHCGIEGQDVTMVVSKKAKQCNQCTAVNPIVRKECWYCLETI